MTGGKSRRETPTVVWFTLGVLVAYAVGYALFAQFTELGKTEDWVLEYSRWITVGIFLVSALIVAGFVLFGMGVRKGNK
jgi:hypothetical protein